MLLSSIRDKDCLTSSTLPYFIDFIAYYSDNMAILVFNWLY